MENASKWHRLTPWYLTIISTLSLVLVAYYLNDNVEWYKTSAVDNPDLMADGKYRIFIYSTHLSLMKRSLGIITGVAITFIGLGVSFYAMEKATETELSGFAKFTTFSPGLFAIVFGCFLISKSIDSKDSIEFAPSNNTEVKQEIKTDTQTDTTANE